MTSPSGGVTLSGVPSIAIGGQPQRSQAGSRDQGPVSHSHSSRADLDQGPGYSVTLLINLLCQNHNFLPPIHISPAVFTVMKHLEGKGGKHRLCCCWYTVFKWHFLNGTTL